MSYASFLEAKKRRHVGEGLVVDDCHQSLFEFQKAIVRWALRKGRACVFAGTGLGKTRMQCEWVRHIPGYRLIVAPLAVADQTIREARCLTGMRVRRVRDSQDITDEAVYIVNYDRLHTTECINWDAVVLDESSILKSHDGAYRKYLQDRFMHTRFRLACTATPSPNDYMELGTHSEFVGAMTRAEMLATFFTHDGSDTSKWRLKKHAVGDFWRWVSEWAVVLSHPRDLGFEQDGYDLPALNIHDHVVQVDAMVGGGLFGDAGINAMNIHAVLKESAEARADVVAKIIESDPGCWLIWVNTDHEQNLIEKMIPGITSVRGSDKESDKEQRLVGFANGTVNMLVTKSKIGGFGMNWQHCNRMIFCGVNYSFEQMYQSIRRCWRFGQLNPVDVHIVTCNAQETVRAALLAKQDAFANMAHEMKMYCDIGSSVGIR